MALFDAIIDIRKGFIGSEDDPTDRNDEHRQGRCRDSQVDQHESRGDGDGDQPECNVVLLAIGSVNIGDLYRTHVIYGKREVDVAYGHSVCKQARIIVSSENHD